MEKIAPLSSVSSAAPVLHPMLDRNTSNFGEVSFSKSINSTEYFYTDHVVAGYRTLPGVAYIEMACAAYKEVMGHEPAQIRNMIWSAPINSETKGD
ncbi:hypothetical protein CS022_23880, partial [Veronia nyctiphanis]